MKRFAIFTITSLFISGIVKPNLMFGQQSSKHLAKMCIRDRLPHEHYQADHIEHPL